MTGEAKRSSGSSGPLDGLTVIDASRVLAGPFCGMQLGDLGADVIKIERPDGGDQTRGWRPPTYGDSDQAAYYLSINRNKRSVTVNLGTDEGRAVLRRLASEADVLIENFRVGKMDDWGVGYADLRTANPDLVYCHITGYGEWGPDRNRPAYDLIMQAEGGMMSITGLPDEAPVRVGVAITDIVAGLYATQSIQAALLERELGGAGGQKIDISLLDGVVSLMSYMAEFYFATGEAPSRQGSKIPNIVPYQAFETRDGWAVIGVPSPNLWPKFCRAIDREDLITAYPTNAERVEGRDELEPVLAAEIAAFTTDEILDRLADHDVPATGINDMAAVFHHEQVLARGMRAAVDHPTIGDLELPGVPFHFSRTPAEIRRHPPLLGEHTEDVLREFGFSPAEIERLRDADAL